MRNGNLIGRNEPKVGVPTFICPAVGSGRSWNYGAHSPRTGLFYSTGIERRQQITARTEAPKEDQNFFGGGRQLKKPLEGEAGSHLDAYDPVSGKRARSHPAKYPCWHQCWLPRATWYSPAIRKAISSPLDSQTGMLKPAPNCGASKPAPAIAARL
jgi:hypothetical protein